MGSTAQDSPSLLHEVTHLHRSVQTGVVEELSEVKRGHRHMLLMLMSHLPTSRWPQQAQRPGLSTVPIAPVQVNEQWVTWQKELGHTRHREGQRGGVWRRQ